MKKQVIVCMSIIIGALACKNTEKVNTEKLDDMKTQEQWVAEGYRPGAIVEDTSAETPCDFLIEVKALGMTEAGELSREFKKDGLLVWVKVIPQRRQSICTGTTPVELVDIQKRDS